MLNQQIQKIFNMLIISIIIVLLIILKFLLTIIKKNLNILYFIYGNLDQIIKCYVKFENDTSFYLKSGNKLNISSNINSNNSVLYIYKNGNQYNGNQYFECFDNFIRNGKYTNYINLIKSKNIKNILSVSQDDICNNKNYQELNKYLNEKMDSDIDIEFDTLIFSSGSNYKYIFNTFPEIFDDIDKILIEWETENMHDFLLGMNYICVDEYYNLNWEFNKQIKTYIKNK